MKLEPCETVGDLIEQLKRVDPNMPLHVSLSDGVLPIVMRDSLNEDVLSLEDPEDWEDDE